MLSQQELLPLIAQPREDLDAEYKNWLDLTENQHRAILAKAAIALANYGGGFIVIGFEETSGTLSSTPRPQEIPETAQDAVNNAVRRYCSPRFHCEMYTIEHPKTGVQHPVISVPGNLTVPVMSKRASEGIIVANRCYLRKPGPCSEEPNTSDEWRTLFNKCIRAGRNEMLDAIRSIVHGQVEGGSQSRDASGQLREFCDEARKRWHELIADEPGASPARFSYGYYEMGFSFIGATPLTSLIDLRNKLSEAGRTSLTGWPPFLELNTAGGNADPYDDYVEAWLGRKVEDDILGRRPGTCDYWRASPACYLYTIRGYSEDGPLQDYTYASGEVIGPGEVIDLTLPIWRVCETLLFAERFAATLDDVEELFFNAKFCGLRGRRFVSLTKERGFHENRISQTDVATMEGRATPEQMENNLVEIVRSLLAPLYEKFRFFQLSSRLVREEIEHMRTWRG